MEVDSKTRKLTMAAVMAALIFVVTFLVRIPIPATNGGYLNLGDTVIFICAYLLGGPIAAAAAGVGSALADMASGYAIYAIPTLIIKGLMGFVVGVITKRHGFGFYALACVTGGGIMVLGYAVFEYFAFGPGNMLAGLPFNLIQWAVSVAVALAFYSGMRRLALHFKFRA